MSLLRDLLILFACVLTVSATTPMNPLSDEFIENINSKQTLWRAGRNFPSNTPLENLKTLAGVDPDRNLPPSVQHSSAYIEKLPESFDSREKWPNCPSLNEIRDQGCCASSWAVAAVEVMTDRVCIYSNGSRQFHFSAEDLLSCCANTGGCQKGKITRAWSHWKSNGIVSGGNYNSNQGCRPYSIPPCEHRATYSGESENELICGEKSETPKCERTCDKNYDVSYGQDKIYGKKVYSVELEIHIKAELMKKGPVQAVFWLYADFFNYKSGVYYLTGGDFMGFHSVKLIGWGVENGTKYWLAANSWGSEWGDHGFFKILRGENHLEIASTIMAGKPTFKKPKRHY